ncbi:MAG: SDR family oxidoreductase [Candidatus Omnitrophica bacterium]|nr:SDR family oxidoreductase [Candidatus Omnitrophota bacterium]
MPTCLITGGAGFIGSHLVSYLLNKRFKVICIDNFLTGNPRNLDNFIDNPDFKFINQDVTKYLDIQDEVHYILHFASPASPADYLRFPIPTLKVGALGTHNALGLAKAKKATFLLASTSEVYGDPLVNPQPESYWGNVNPIGPRGVYDEAKRFAEALTMAYHRNHGIDTKIVRIFNTYGPGMRKDDGRAIPNFLYQALKGEPLTVFGDGSQTRSFCYISDMVEGIFRLLTSNINEPVNIGNPSEFTILELARLIIKLTDSKDRIIFKSLPTDDPKVRRPDITRAKELLGWQPAVGLEEGLRKTIESQTLDIST